MAFRVVKQLFPAPSSSVSGGITFRDPIWAQREFYVGRLSGSNEQIWEFSGSGAETNANAKAAQLSGSDDTDRKYKVIEV
jgi:hypothetical protein